MATKKDPFQSPVISVYEKQTLSGAVLCCLVVLFQQDCKGGLGGFVFRLDVPAPVVVGGNLAVDANLQLGNPSLIDTPLAAFFIVLYPLLASDVTAVLLGYSNRSFAPHNAFLRFSGVFPFGSSILTLKHTYIQGIRHHIVHKYQQEKSGRSYP